MIQITSQMRIVVAVVAVDFRRELTAWPVCVARCGQRPVVGLAIGTSQSTRDRDQDSHVTDVTWPIM